MISKSVSKSDMRIIAHRGNICGSDPLRENRLDYVSAALDDGFDVEVDVRVIDGILMLGHDKPQEQVSLSFLQNNRVWVHAKNTDALTMLLDDGRVNVFWHDADDYALTAFGDLWTHPKAKPLPSSIFVMPETLLMPFDSGQKISDLIQSVIGQSVGICSDFARNIREKT